MSQKNNNELPKQAAENTLNLNPAIGIRGKDLFTSTRMVLLQVVRQSLHSVRHMVHFSLELKNALLGQSEPRPGDDDRRFSDPAWSQNPLYKRYIQTYLVWRKELHSWISHSDPSLQDTSRGQFVINLLTEAMSPTSSLNNPATVKHFFETGGKSLLDGPGYLAKNLVNNGGVPSQVDMDAFEVGKNLATIEGAVVFRNDMLELIQYRPITESVHERPLLVVPSRINKFYVFDPSPDRSLARFRLHDGVQTLVVSWHNPTKSQREWGLTTYIEALKEAIEIVLSITGSKDLNLLGTCSGGITTVTLVGHYVANGEKKINAFTQLVDVLDFELNTQVALFTDEKTLEATKRRFYQSGVLEGKDMARVFVWMRPNDLIWNYWVNNYLLDNQSPALDVLCWNDDTTHLLAALHGEFVELFESNLLNRPGALGVSGTPIGLKQVTCDFYCVAGLNDHTTPWESRYKLARLLGGKCKFILSNSSHIQSTLNPPSNPKARLMINPELPAGPKAWLKQAGKRADSWWLYRQQWLAECSGKTRKTPASLGNRTYPAGEAAPGTYVHER